MFTVHSVSDDLYRLELVFDHAELRDLIRSTNVYVCVGLLDSIGSICLINGGHHSQLDALQAALADLSLSFENVERVVYTSWSAFNTGTAGLACSHLVASPDYWRPRDYGRELQERRRDLEIILDHLGADASHAQALWGPEDAWDIVPLRDGHHVNAAGMALQVHTAPGPNDGHILLHAPETGRLFTGDLAYSGLPFWIDETQGYLVGLERGIALDPAWVFPNSGEPSNRGQRTLQRALRWSNNFLTNVSGLLFGAPTLQQFIERDLGRDDLSALEIALRMLTARPFLEELERTNMIQCVGEGLDRRYGVNIADPTSRLRPWA